MHEITEPREMRAWSRAERAKGRRIGFVPTMGSLHEGHLRLVDRARDHADRVVLSVFVNPLQFGPQEDFERYPRSLADDRRLAAVREVDGLALSSRNAYLDPDQRRAALALSRALRAVEQAWRGGESNPVVLERRGMEVLRIPGVTPEYLAIVGEAVRPVKQADARAVVVIAARVGATRLIDNVVLGEGAAGDVAVGGRA